MTRHEGLVVADDLTGAMDTGHAFATRGFETVVRYDLSFAAAAQVLVVDTDSRYADPDAARQHVHDTVEGTDAALVYKKVDSTLRGNLGPEVEAAADAMGADAVAVAPAFPSNDRVTADGYHLVGGRPVADTEPGNDPESPVDDSHLPQFLRTQTAHPVSHVGVYPVATGDVAAHLDRTPMTEHAYGHVVFDAVHNTHLDAIAGGAASTDADTLLVGSGGLAEYARVPSDPASEREAPLPEPRGRAFGVAGSVDPMTRRQLAHLDRERVVELDAVRAVNDPLGAARGAAAACHDRFVDHDAVVLASALDGDAVDRTLAAASEAGVSDRDVRERVEAALAAAAEQVWDDIALDGLFLTGGAVAKAVLDRLGTGGIALRGEEVAAGVPIGIVRGGPADGLPLVTKAGAFGDPDTIVAALDAVRCVPQGNG